MQYEQLDLTKFRMNLQMNLILKKKIQIGIQKTPYGKSFEKRVDIQNCSVNFLPVNRQFDWLEIALV